MLLTNKERSKFIIYLKGNIETSRQLIEQMGKLPMGEMLIKLERTKIAGWMIVVADLESIESFEINDVEVEE